MGASNLSWINENKESVSFIEITFKIAVGIIMQIKLMRFYYIASLQPIFYDYADLTKLQF